MVKVEKDVAFVMVQGIIPFPIYSVEYVGGVDIKTVLYVMVQASKNAPIVEEEVKTLVYIVEGKDRLFVGNVKVKAILNKNVLNVMELQNYLNRYEVNLKNNNLEQYKFIPVASLMMLDLNNTSIQVGQNLKPGMVLNSNTWLKRLKDKIVEAKDRGEAVWITVR